MSQAHEPLAYPAPMHRTLQNRWPPVAQDRSRRCRMFGLQPEQFSNFMLLIFCSFIGMGSQQAPCIQLGKDRWPPQLRGFVCAYHPTAPGSNPKHTIYAFFNLDWDCGGKRKKIKQKRVRDWPIFLKKEKEQLQYLQTMKICRIAQKIAQNRFKILQNPKQTVKKCQILNKNLPNWRNFAKSGHTYRK